MIIYVDRSGIASIFRPRPRIVVGPEVSTFQGYRILSANLSLSEIKIWGDLIWPHSTARFQQRQIEAVA